MNVRHTKRKRTRRHDFFDARHIFKVHGSKDWGEYHIQEVHLSERFKFDESGYYHCCALIPYLRTCKRNNFHPLDSYIQNRIMW
ncbi:hypothetical protein COCNU_02G003810 [Cocos nucifera]|uniref:A-kinase anchor protein 7-like phosphoesterase domain-containing protein n=1 Tax=Cocos nucifera TaxID=13894 RepID=A0A8K0HY53_COCNU|nr:hypothetical protein COCNU_02G003810 [Cocos nucifera]